MTLFSKIAAGEIPSYKVAEDENFYAFLDINPMYFSKKVALAIEKSVSCKRVGMMVIGLEVPHTHVHLIPITREGDMNISNPKLKLEAEEMKAIAAEISRNF